MVLKQLTIENFKGLTHCELCFRPGFNLIIGNNGVGKTSVLEAASVALSAYFDNMGDVSAKNFSMDQVRVSAMPMGDGSFSRQLELPIMVTCAADMNGKTYEWTRRKNSVKPGKSATEPRNICKAGSEMLKNPQSILPVLCFQGATRTWKQKRDQSNTIFDTNFNRTSGYANCLDDASDARSLLNWCAKMEQVSWQKGRPIGEYEAVKKALSTFMSIMNDGAAAQIQYDKQTNELSYLENGLSLPIRLLSDGYQSLVWMVLDIAYRMAILNPNLRENAADSDGIVLIDEMDVHLHPKWQWNVIEALQKTFPNVQFIATTHSPILIAACQKGHLIFMEKDGIGYKETDYGMEINDVLTFTQGSTDMAPVIRKALDQIYDRIDTGDFVNAAAELEKMEATLSEDHPEVIRARTALDFEMAVAEAEA